MSAALHLALLAVECGPGDEVVLPSLNFVAAANAIAHTGAIPLFCDIRGESDLNLDPEDLIDAFGPRTKAVVILHYGGYACDMGAVRELAGARGVEVVEDAAHAPGATWRGERCGTLGRVACFSFFSNKNLPVGEGGMVVTDDDEVAERVRLLRSHGMTTLTWDRHRGHAGGYDVLAQGFNYRLDEIRAARGLSSWDACRRETRPEHASSAAIAPHWRAPRASPCRSDRRRRAQHPLTTWPSFSYRLGAIATRFGPWLSERRIQTSVHYPPIHSFTHYREAGQRRPLPHTEGVAPRLLTLPLYAHMDDTQADAVVEGLLDAV